MTLPTLIVEVGFSSPGTGTYLHLGDQERGVLGTNTLAPTTLLVDVSEFVVSVTTRRGATRADGPTLRYEAGTTTIVLRNDDRRFDPTNLAGPYVAAGVTQVEPMRMVRIRATYGDQTWPLFRGFADNWEVAYDGPSSSYVTLTATDAFMVFASYDRGAIAAVGAGETSGARINRILDSVGWPASDRVTDTGDTTVQATTLADNALTELLLTADSEMGEFYMDREGRVVFRRRLAIQEDQRSAFPQAAFGDNPVDGVATTVNLVSNPSVETNTTGWGAGGGAGAPTLSRSSTRAMFGTYSLLGTWATGGVFPNVNYPISGLTPGRTYTISVYVWVPTGSPAVDTIVAGTDTFGTGSTVFDAWERLTWTGSAGPTGAWEFQLWPRGTATAGQQVWVDGLQVEEGTTATGYVDGSQVGAEWDGVPHASMSRRLPELPYADLGISYDSQSIYNLFLIANAGGTVQTVDEGASRTAYLTHSHQRSDLLLQSDAAARVYGEVLRGRFAYPELRFSGMKLKPLRDTRLWPQVLGRDIGDRVRGYRRPPGGGAPVVRDAFVRGITHTVADGNWVTDWVFEAAPATVRMVDTFTRSTSGGWSSADSGQAWTVDNPASDYSVTGTAGRMATTAINSLRFAHVNVGGSNHRALGVVTVPVVPTGAGISVRVAGRVTDTANYYEANMLIAATSGAATLQISRRVAGAGLAVTSAVSVGTHAAGNTWALLFECVGTTLRAKAWKTSSSEPSPWTVSGTDATLTSGNRVAALVRRETGNTNGVVNIDWADFTATSLNVWT